MELMVIEGGVSNQILVQPFQRYSKWVSHCWLKSVWEKIHIFNLTVEIRALPLPFPRENDDWLMLVFEREGYTDDKLIRLNRVRCHQHVVFIPTYSTREAGHWTDNIIISDLKGTNGPIVSSQPKKNQEKIFASGMTL